MAQEAGRNRFHYGFYAAMKVEYGLIHADVTYEQEIQLGEDPIRLDFLIIKKNADVILHDPIGEFFKAVNIFEYKSPDDGLSIDDFYKAQGYGLIYKGFDRKVNELPIEDMTLTLVRHTYPREMIKSLRQSGFVIHEPYRGIYRFEGKISIRFSISVFFTETDALGLLAVASSSVIQGGHKSSLNFSSILGSSSSAFQLRFLQLGSLIIFEICFIRK